MNERNDDAEPSRFDALDQLTFHESGACLIGCVWCDQEQQEIGGEG